MDRVQKKKRGWMKYVIAELIFLAVGGLFCLLFWRKETERTKENDKMIFSNLEEIVEQTDDGCTAAKAILHAYKTLNETEGYQGNTAMVLEFGTGNPTQKVTFSEREDIAVLFCSKGGVNDAWKLSDYFPKEQLQELWDIVGSHEQWTVNVREIYAEDTVDALGYHRMIPTQIKFQCGISTITLKDTTRFGTLCYRNDVDSEEDGTGEVDASDWITPGDFFYIPKSSDVRFLAELTVNPDCILSGPYNDVLVSVKENPDGTGEFVSYNPVVKARAGYIVFFNRDAIVRERLIRPLLLGILFSQAAILYIMIIIWGTEKRRAAAKQMRDTFINAMAHQLKTPVAVVQNTAEYLATGNHPEKQGHYCDVLVHEGENMNRLLNRMLTYSRVMDRGVTLKMQEVSLDSLVDEVLESHQEIIPERGILIDFTERNGTTVKCDPDLIRMVIDNMVANAIRYGEEGSTIRIRTDGMAFSVYNRGDRFSEGEIDNIWTPMFAAKKQEESGGTGGMGLAISAGILDRHGAYYSVENEADGVRFGFNLAGSGKRAKEEKAVGLNLITVTLDILLAFMYGWQFLTKKNMWFLLVSGLWLVSGMCFLISFFSYHIYGKRRRRTA